MTKIPLKAQRLAQSAGESARWRGHDMGRFIRASASNSYHFVGTATCIKCGMEVTIDTHPPANGIDIGGEAVALDCKGWKQ